MGLRDRGARHSRGGIDLTCAKRRLHARQPAGKRCHFHGLPSFLFSAHAHGRGKGGQVHRGLILPGQQDREASSAPTGASNWHIGLDFLRPGTTASAPIYSGRAPCGLAREFFPRWHGTKLGPPKGKSRVAPPGSAAGQRKIDRDGASAGWITWADFLADEDIQRRSDARQGRSQDGRMSAGQPQ